MLIPLDIPPGVYRNGTEAQSAGRYYDADLWRWFEDTKRPVGGWRKKSADPVTGKARAILTWVDNANQAWAAVGTHEGLFVFTRGGALHDITPVDFVAGRQDASTGGGYGRGKYGQGRYGTPRPDNTNVIPASVWTLDTFGEVLIACFGGVIYEWDLNVANPATPLADGSVDPDDAAPSAEAIFTTEEGAVVALGAASDPRKVEWADPENRHMWKPAGTNLTGGFRVQSSGRLMCGKRISGGAILHTNVDCHLMQYNVGNPDIYDVRRLASGCGIISKQAAAVVDARDYWMAPNGFWVFNGTVDPLPCDVGDYVFSNINRGQVSKIHAVHNSQFGEIWWFYPSAGSMENDRYVLFNYREGHWNIGALARLSGTDRGVFGYPLMVDPDGYLYEHEVGQNRDGRQPYAISGAVELGTGERVMSVYGIVPDEETLGDVEVSFVTADWTMSPEYDQGPFTLSAKTDCRFSARRVAVKLEAQPDRDFRVGVFRFEAKVGGKR